VTSLQNCIYKITIELTFEKFYVAGNGEWKKSASNLQVTPDMILKSPLAIEMDHLKSQLAIEMDRADF